MKRRAWTVRALAVAGITTACAIAFAPSRARAEKPAALQLRPLATAPRLAAPQPPQPSSDPRARAVAETLRAHVEVARARAEQMRAQARATRPLVLPLPQQQAADALRRAARGDVEIYLRRETGTPRLVRGASLEPAARARSGRDRATDTARSFLRKRAALLRLDDPDRELALQRIQRDALGRTQLRFGQRLGGLRVWPAEVIVHVDPSGDVDAMDGASVATPAALETTPGVGADRAVAAARAHVAGADAASIGTPELFVYTGSGSPRLAWKVFVPAALRDQWWVVVDARSGDVVNAWNTAEDADFAGSGTDAFGAPESIHVWNESPGSFFLVDTSKAMFNAGASNPPDPDTTIGGIVVFDAGNQPPNANPQQFPTLFQLTSSTGADPWRPQGATSGPSVGDGVSALLNLSRVYDYYLNVHGRNSLDGAGASLLAVVRLGQNFQNAFFMSESNIMAFGDAEKYAGALDVVGHEMTHGVTHHTANLLYQNESGALNEAMSDIFGEMVEANATGHNDWLIGTQLSAPIRNMANPAQFGDPAKYSQRLQTTSDNGGVHTNSGIINHAYYLLAEGLGPSAVGRAKAEAIFYRALTTHLTASANFVDARLAAIQSAQELSGVGVTAADVQAVRDAFTQVEVFDGPGTQPPDPFPGTTGTDSTLFVRFDPQTGGYFLGRKEIQSDGANGAYLSAFDVKTARPAVSGDGSEAAFVDSIDGLCFIPTDASATELCDPSLSHSVSSVSVSPDGNLYGFVLLDTLTSQPDNQIYVFDLRKAPPNDVQAITVEAPAIDAGTIATVLYADQMDFTADDKTVVFDALTNVAFTGSGSGAADVQVWALYSVDLATGTIFAVAPPVPGFDIGYPALAQRSDIHLVFDVVDQSTGNGSVLAGNLETGDLAEVAALAGSPAFPAFGVPSYTGADDAVIFSVQDDLVNTGVSLKAQGVAADRITATGARGAWLEDADFGVVYRRGTFAPEPGAAALAGGAVAALAMLARRRGR